ncbi:PqqD family protein [Candidatus Omnitrophota bacterium]
MLNQEARIIKNDKVPWRIIEDEAILVDVRKGNVIQLNEVGAFIWNQIDGIQKICQIVDSICDSFQIDRETAKQDAVEFLSELLKRQIIKLK